MVTRPEHLDIHARARMIYGMKRTQQGTSLLKIGWCLMRAMSLVARDCHDRILVDISHQDIWDMKDAEVVCDDVVQQSVVHLHAKLELRKNKNWLQKVQGEILVHYNAWV